MRPVTAECLILFLGMRFACCPHTLRKRLAMQTWALSLPLRFPLRRSTAASLRVAARDRRQASLLPQGQVMCLRLSGSYAPIPPVLSWTRWSPGSARPCLPSLRSCSTFPTHPTLAMAREQRSCRCAACWPRATRACGSYCRKRRLAPHWAVTTPRAPPGSMPCTRPSVRRYWRPMLRFPGQPWSRRPCACSSSTRQSFCSCPPAHRPARRARPAPIHYRHGLSHAPPAAPRHPRARRAPHGDRLAGSGARPGCQLWLCLRHREQ